jgi:hypothetical protein
MIVNYLWIINKILFNVKFRRVTKVLVVVYVDIGKTKWEIRDKARISLLKESCVPGVVFTYT